MTGYICTRVSDMPDPAVPSHKDTCSKCGEDVWASDALAEEAKDYKVFCFPCAIETSDGKPPDIRITDTQLAELKAMGFSERDIVRAMQYGKEVLKGNLPRP